MGSQIHGPYDLLNPIQTLLKVFVNTLAIPSISFPQGVFSIFHRAPIGSLEIDWGLYGITLSIHCGNWGISESSPSFAMNDSETRRSPLRTLHLIGKTSIFSKTSHFYGVAPDESTDRKATERKLHETQMEKTMILLCFGSILLPSTA